MADTSWLRQTTDKPLFPDLLWSRPENKRQAGKLLIVGGNLHGFAAVAAAYAAATKAGTGSIRMILPDVLKKTLGESFAETEFAPTTPSGGFARGGLDLLIENAKWADGVLLAGDFGRNSETAIFLETFANQYNRQLTITDDAVDYFINFGNQLFVSYNFVITTDAGKLQKMLKPILIQHGFDLFRMVQQLAEWSSQEKAHIITKHADNFIVASDRKASTTPAKTNENWQIGLATYASVWWLQNPARPFEAITSAVFDYLNTLDNGII